MDFWYAGHRLPVHKKDLVVLIKDPKNWRPGEIARVDNIETEAPQEIALNLEFHDGHRHRERSYAPLLLRPPLLSFGSPLKETLGVYLRYPESPNGNPAHQAMIDLKCGLGDLVRDYQEMMRAHRAQLPHLSPEWLDTQYRLLFEVPLPIGIS
ncbi:MAG: hypothetical protein AABX53_03715 [Nanoarchaeota archaeon]